MQCKDRIYPKLFQNPYVHLSTAAISSAARSRRKSAFITIFTVQPVSIAYAAAIERLNCWCSAIDRAPSLSRDRVSSVKRRMRIWSSSVSTRTIQSGIISRSTQSGNPARYPFGVFTYACVSISTLPGTCAIACAARCCSRFWTARSSVRIWSRS